jgi:phospholipase C
MRFSKALGFASFFTLMLMGAGAVADDNNQNGQGQNNQGNFNFGNGYNDFDQVHTKTPIKHIVIIFGENESFDHYFGTYPLASNPVGEPHFAPLPFTPPVNGLDWKLLNQNPNFENKAVNGAAAFNPFRLDRTQAVTGDQDHDYTPEQKAFDDGKMDAFPANTGTNNATGKKDQSGNPLYYSNASTGAFATTGLVMGYFDGNTVTGLWNYAQHFAMSDNSYGSQFGPSTTGAVNLVSGQTNGAVYYAGPTAGSATIAADNSSVTDDGHGGLTIMGDPDPFLDVCSLAQSGSTDQTAELKGKNIGDLLNAKNISWGWFQGGFDLTLNNTGTNNYPHTTLPGSYYTGSTGTPKNGAPVGCVRASVSSILTTANGSASNDFVPHHEAFQYYASTRNPNHNRPASVQVIGTSADTATDQYVNNPNEQKANHQYDTHDFFDVLANGNLPSVSFLKAPKFQNAHPGNSDPLDEQAFVVNVVNALEDSKFWENTMVVLAYDDSDGWYDHANHVINPSSNSNVDALEGTGVCKSLPGTFPAFNQPLPGIKGQPVNGRCGYGPRLPLLVISPYARHNFVDHTVTDQSSIINFIEDNWLNGERIGQGNYDAVAGSLFNMLDFNQLPYTKVKLDPATGLVVPGGFASNH